MFPNGTKIRKYLRKDSYWNDIATLDKMLKRIIAGMPAHFHRKPHRYRVSAQRCRRRREVRQVCEIFDKFIIIFNVAQFANDFVLVFFFLSVGGVLTSPSPTHYAFSRWSTSRLNSGTNSSSTSPCGSARSSFNYRQPYLGWRSQEKLSKPRTPAERLAAGLLPQYQVRRDWNWICQRVSKEFCEKIRINKKR